MADYIDLKPLAVDQVLRDRVEVAIWVKAQTILDDGAPSAAEVQWASDALENPSLKATQIINYVLAANKSASESAILGAADTAVQSNVDAAVDALIAGGA